MAQKIEDNAGAGYVSGAIDLDAWYDYKDVEDPLKEATLKALNDRKDEVILYSPMFASYDQYSSFEERGKEFNKIVLNYYK